VHFLWGTKADSLMHAVRHLIVRARPSPNEVRILFGLARQLRWVAEHGVSIAPAADVEAPSE
jgi:tRNA/rRNA methyltransferase